MNKIIPLRPEAPQGGDCASAESFALMVLGDSMEPEFHQGEIIIIEPEGLAKDGSYVLAWHDEEFIFRQLKKHEDGWWLVALNPAYPAAYLGDDLSAVRGVIIQKCRPGRRRVIKSYLE